MTNRLTKAKREKFYDREVAPALLGLMNRCLENGLSFLAVVEWEPGKTGRTFGNSPGSGYGIRLANTAAETGNNVDALFFAVMRHAREHGHSSMFLSRLGVPTRPCGEITA